MPVAGERPWRVLHGKEWVGVVDVPEGSALEPTSLRSVMR